MADFAIVIHGGAGGLPRSEESARLRHAGAAAALEAGHAVLAARGSALDAVEAAVVVLEDDPVFNAGRGSALTEDGTVELDAAVMDGDRRAAGAVASVRGVRNPVRAARALMEEGRHVLVVGDAAAKYARDLGLEMCPERWFVVDHGSDDPAGGTVGAVARDVHGGLATATSTGGTPMKRRGRVGDSPLIGCGTWADDDTAAVSCTGDGETIVRCALAHEVDALLRYAGEPLGDACTAALARLARFGGQGGLIALSAEGDPAAQFTTPAMTYGWRVGDGPVHTAVGADA